MIWICERGHTVIGCDLADVAAREFFEENNIPYSTSGMTLLFMLWSVTALVIVDSRSGAAIHEAV